MPTEFAGKGLPMSADGMTKGCDRLGVKAAEIWAVLTVETRGSGFLPDRRPQILFERHIFRRETGGAFDATAPEVSNPVAGGYGALGAHQYDRLAQAIQLDRQAALRSTSWGIGQVMGFNAGIAGFPDAEAMVVAMVNSEDAQLNGMFGFLMANQLDGPLRSHDWTSFARGYNGAGFAKNQYDVRLAAAFQKFSTGLLPDLAVREAQIYLTYDGLDPGPVDGTLGRMTRSAVMQFQHSRGLPETGDLDDATLGELREQAASTDSGALAAGAGG
jgi:hypothetical protein